MSNKQRNKPALTKSEGHEYVLVEHSISSTNESTPYGATPSLALIPQPQPESLDPGPSMQSHSVLIHAESARRSSSSEQNHGASPPTLQLENPPTPLLSPFSDPILPEHKKTPSTDEQRTESRAMTTSTDSLDNEDYDCAKFLDRIEEEAAQTSSRSNKKHVRHHTSVPSLPSSSMTIGRTTVIPRMPSVQSIRSARPNVTMDEVGTSSADAGELDDANSAPAQPLPPLPPRTQRLANSTSERFTRWFTQNFIPIPMPPMPQENIEMSDLHRLDSETREPRIVPMDQGSRQQSGQVSGSQTQQVVQVQQPVDRSLRARLEAIPFWVCVSLCVVLAFVFMGVLGGSVLAVEKRGSASQMD